MIIICRYGEISLKGNNRSYFERKLIENIKAQFNAQLPGTLKSIKKMSGRFIADIKDNDISIIEKILKTTFGLVSFSIAHEIEQNIEIIKKKLWELINDRDFNTFRITTQRSNKDFPLTSEQINKEVGGYIFEKINKPVSLKNPELNCFIEIVDNKAFIYFDKIPLSGGMPVGTSGKSLTLLSGGIDSPVAASYIIKRGSRNDFMHFHSMPYTTPASVEKAKKLAEALNKFQLAAKIFMIPFAETQQEIMMKTPSKLRVILYRRFMMRIAEKIARKEKYHALVTGDSLAQVASQTLENIDAVNEAVKIPVFRPLIGFDKEEIMQRAREIGTYEISILPHEDCCTRLMPQKPETHAKIQEVLKAEENLDVERMVNDAIEKMEIVKI